MAGSVAFERRNNVGIITVDNPPVNALSQAVRSGLAESLRAALADPAVEVIVLRASGRTFIAGADITEFGKPPTLPMLGAVIQAYDESTKPVVVAIHGTALGGGLEVALGCNYRVATPDAKCGLPEVKLGILPGAGGTQRLPRLVGVEKALEIIVGGDPISAKDAKAIGLVDAIIEGDLLTGAVEFAASVANKKPLPRVRDLTANVDPAKIRPGSSTMPRRTQRSARAAPPALRAAWTPCGPRWSFPSTRVSRASASSSKRRSPPSNRERCAMCSSPSGRPRRSRTCPATCRPFL